MVTTDGVWSGGFSQSTELLFDVGPIARSVLHLAKAPPGAINDCDEPCNPAEGGGSAGGGLPSITAIRVCSWN